MCILIAEDEPIVLLAVQIIFELAGFMVHPAAHGQAAIEHIEQNPSVFTCLITDFNMPGELTGAHVIQHMRPLYPTIPMILTTALPDAVTDDWRREMQVRLFPKPYDPDALLQTVHKMLAA